MVAIQCAMKGKRFTVEQIVAILKQSELEMPVGDILRHVGISEQTYIDGRSNTPALSPAK